MTVGDRVITPLGFKATVTAIHGSYIHIRYDPESGSAVRVNVCKRESLRCVA